MVRKFFKTVSDFFKTPPSPMPEQSDDEPSKHEKRKRGDASFPFFIGGDSTDASNGGSDGGSGGGDGGCGGSA